MSYCTLCGDYGGHVEPGECSALDEPLFEPAPPHSRSNPESEEQR